MVRSVGINKKLFISRGTHWTLFYKNLNGLYEYFDSLGNTDDSMKKLSSYIPYNHVITNNTQVQSSKSISCGEFTIYFISEILSTSQL